MLFVTVNDSEKRIIFKHGMVESEVAQKDGNTVKATHPKSTECVIINTKTGTVIGEGQASCHTNDHFEYERGRKLALGRALAKTGLDRAARGIVWNAYHSRG